MNEIARANQLMDRLLYLTDIYMAEVRPGESENEVQRYARQEADTIRAELMDMGFHAMAWKLGADKTPEEKREAVEWWRADMADALLEAGEDPMAISDPGYQWQKIAGESTGGMKDETLLMKIGLVVLVIILLNNLFRR